MVDDGWSIGVAAPLLGGTVAAQDPARSRTGYRKAIGRDVSWVEVVGGGLSSLA